jgi:hypothetical protein
MHIVVLLALLVCLCAGYQGSSSSSSRCDDALPLTSRMPPYSRPVSTRSAAAQARLDQAFVLAYAFNHDEAKRSLSRALLHDPECAMAYFLLASCNANNINRVMTREMLSEAQAAASNASSIARARPGRLLAVERALVEALQQRFAAGRTLDNGEEYERAYMHAMAKVRQTSMVLVRTQRHR